MRDDRPGSDASAPGGEPPPFPIAATVADVAVVTIPLTEYADLLKCRRVANTNALAAFALPPRSRIEADPEIASLLRERLGKIAVSSIIAECLERFGARRTPSRTAVYDFWQRLRRRGSRSV